MVLLLASSANYSRLRIDLVRFLSASAQAATSTNKRTIRRLLVANRGEIAIRVMKTCRRLGIRTIAVYSTADAKALHVQSADESYCIGPPAPQLSYLNKEKLIDICRQSAAEAVHPGYGFLSENAEFSDLCKANNVIFVGPPAQAMRDMGLKSLSKRIMEKANVPVIPGYHGDEQSDARLTEEADRIGFPLMIKAIRGGGGKGMRIAMTKAEFAPQLESARREAINSFADDAMLLERYIERPRHVEVQVFGDTHGNYVYLWERDCSVQRRHQKIIEEAPAPGLTPETRKALGEAACAAARAVGYHGAGTVEFILDADGKSFYFMEMNTRLQVEHPVTEMITDQDLVEWQIRVAQGEKLPLTQCAIPFNGHGFEARIYAEDTDNNFMPAPGPLRHLKYPKDNVQFSILGIDKSAVSRIDSGVRHGDDVSVHYDPMIAKLVVWGPDRVSALRRLVSALSQTHIVGLPTNINFLLKLATNKAFGEARVHTGFIAEEKENLFAKPAMTSENLIQASIALIVNERNSLTAQHGAGSAASLAFGFRPNSSLKRTMSFSLGTEDEPRDVHVSVEYLAPNRFRLTVEGDSSAKPVIVSINSSAVDPSGEIAISYTADDNRSYSYSAVSLDGAVHLFQQEGLQTVRLKVPKYASLLSGAHGSGGAGGKRVISPMPGVLNRILVKPGDSVKKGESLIVLIAMKMEYVIRAPRDGKIKSIPFAVGQTVQKDAELILFEEEQPQAK